MIRFKKTEFKLQQLWSRWSGKHSPPHYVSDYRQHVKSLLKTLPEADAMGLAVGGEFHSFGMALKDLVIQCGLKEGMTLVDIGCGSGRLTHALRHLDINYVGTDVVPELVRYAKKLCQRPDWRFDVVTDLKIPVPDASADMVVFISVFTHLRHEESFIYLMEARRILKPNGIVLFTFLDFSQPGHWIVFERFVETVRSDKAPMHVDQFVDKSAISAWATMLGFEIDRLFDGSQEYIRLSQDIIRDDGRKSSGDMTIGQSACVLRKS